MSEILSKLVKEEGDGVQINEGTEIVKKEKIGV